MPKKLLSRAVGKLAAAEMGQGTAFLIERFVKYYNVDMKEAKIQDIAKFKSFNDFFTRELKKGARPVVSDENALAEPADGTMSELGEIYKDAVLQAKGHYYSLEALLGGRSEDAAYFENGSFATTYLSPRDYHRVHMPLTGKLEKMLFIPGELFSVNPLTARNVDNLFARNERVVCFFNNEKIGRFAVVLVGATIVASIATVFAGLVAPAAGKKVTVYNYAKDNIVLEKGAELGRFLLGSTVICIFPKGKVKFAKGLANGTPVKMGERLGEIKKYPAPGTIASPAVSNSSPPPELSPLSLCSIIAPGTIFLPPPQKIAFRPLFPIIGNPSSRAQMLVKFLPAARIFVGLRVCRPDAAQGFGNARLAVKRNHLQPLRFRQFRRGEITQQRVRQTVEPKALEPVVRPEIELPVFLYDHCRHILLRCRAELANDFFRVPFVIFLDVSERADHPRIAARLANLISLFAAAVRPVVNRINPVVLRIVEKFVQIADNQRVKVKEKHPLPAQTRQIVVAQSRSLPVIAENQFRRHIEHRQRPGNNILVQSLCPLGKTVKVNIVRCVAFYRRAEFVDVFGTVISSPFDADNVKSFSHISPVSGK